MGPDIITYITDPDEIEEIRKAGVLGTETFDDYPACLCHDGSLELQDKAALIYIMWCRKKGRPTEEDGSAEEMKELCYDHKVEYVPPRPCPISGSEGTLPPY